MYVDGFVLVVPTKNMSAYKKMAQKAGRVWRDHGALDYKECVGDDLAVKWGVPFGKLTQAKKNETVCFAWITYKSRAHRDAVNAKVMKDKRMADCMNAQTAPFDCKRMSYGGFKVLVNVSGK